MNAIGFSGYSGSGKTTLVEQVVAHLKARGLRVSVVKHAHQAFDIGHPGKDSWRHRQAGAQEELVASSRRLALIHEFDAPQELEVNALLGRLSDCDWALVEGFRHGELPKIEVWRPETGQVVHYPQDPRIVAVATTWPLQLPETTALPVLDLDRPAQVVEFLLAQAERLRWTARRGPAG